MKSPVAVKSLGFLYFSRPALWTSADFILARPLLSF